VVGEVTGSDRFGNVLTSITGEALEGFGATAILVEIGGRTLPGLLPSYDAAPEGGAGALVGSGGHLEVFVREGSAAGLLGVGRGARVRVRRVTGLAR
jgi:S-adenosylmethionine hydrolase